MRRLSWRLAFFVLNLLGLLFLLYRVGSFSSQSLIVTRTFPLSEETCQPDDVGDVTVEFGGLIDPGSVKADAIRLLPYVPGTVRLEGERILHMLLSKKLAPATRYQVEVSPQVRGVGGEKPQSRRFFFLTPSLTVGEVTQARIEADLSSILAIRFSSSVNPQALVNSLELTDPQGHSIAFTPIGGKPDREVQIQIPRTEWDELRLRIKKGLTGTEGPLPLGADYQATVKVTVQLQFIGMKTEQSVDGDGSSPDAIKIQMNSPIELESAEQFIAITPNVKHTFESYGGGLEIRGEFKSAQRYVVTLKPGLAAGAAGTLLEEITRSVWFPDATPSVRFPYGDGILSTRGLLTIPVRSTNVKSFSLAVYRLYTNNLVEYAFREYAERFGDFGTLLKQTEIRPLDQKNQEIETLLRLDQLITGNMVGVYSLQIGGDDNRWDRDSALMVVSDLGLSVRRDSDHVLIWVTSLASGKPLANCNVTLYSDRRQNLGMAVTDADGLAGIVIPPMPENEKPALLIAGKSEDLNYVALSQETRDRGTETAEGRAYLKRGYEVFSFTDRGVYRPGDEVHISAMVRDAELLHPNPMPLSLVVQGPGGREILRKTVVSDATGRLAAHLPIVNSSPSGRYEVSWHLPSKSEALGSADFQVADYIPQTLRVTVRTDDNQTVGDHEMAVHVHTEHLFGGPTSGLVAKCRYRCRAADFLPKEWEQFKFGDERKKREIGSLTVLPEGKLDSQGNATFTLKVPTVETPAALRVEVEVEVLEPGGRAITEYLTRTLNDASFYLGIRLPDTGISAGQTGLVKLIATAPDGSMAKTADNFTATLYRVTYSNVLRKQNGRLVYDWTRHETPESTQQGSFTQGQASLTIGPKFSGSYRLVVEAEGGCSVTFDFQAAGPGTGWVSDDPEQVNLTLDKTAYKSGETARVHVRSPFAGTALLTIETSRVLEHRIIHLAGGEGVEVFNVKEEWRPNAYVTATVVHPVQPEKDWQPHRASGVVRLKLDCIDRRLELKVESPDHVRPGQKMDVAVRVLAAGQAQSNAAVTLVAVDEGVLALTRYATPSPWDFFYAIRRLDIQEIDIYDRLAPELAAWRLGKKLLPGGGGGPEDDLDDMGRRLNPIQARRIKTAVLYAGSLMTDSQGLARTTFTIPEYIGELRIMAIASSENRFGSIQQPLKVKCPLMTQTSWPRFLAPNDRFQVPITVFNRTGKDQSVTVNLKYERPLQAADNLSQTIQMPSDFDKRILFILKATGVGKVSARITAQAGQESYTESVEIPVRPAVGFERKFGRVTVEAGSSQQFSLEGTFLPGTTKTALTIAGSQLVEFSDAVRNLLEYPYGCVEQTTSKLVPLIYLGDLARLTDPDAVGKQEIGALLSAGFLRLQTMQTYSGGLAMWPGQTDPYPWGSLYAGDLLVEAQKTGYEVPHKLLDPLITYINEQIKIWATARDNVRPTQLAETAYGCYVLARVGEPSYAWMSTLEETIRDCDAKKIEIPATARFHLAAAYLACGQGKAGKELITGTFPTLMKRQTEGCLDSPLRETAIKLLVLLDIDPESGQIPVLVENLRRGLLSRDTRTTQESAFALMAMGKYARRIGQEADGEVTVALLNGAKKAFSARRGASFNDLKPNQAVEITFQGRGKICAFWHTEGVPIQGQTKEQDSGLSIRRTFYTIDGKKPINGEPFRQGELYQVLLRIGSKDAVDNLAIVDLLPAGLEIADLELKTSPGLTAKNDWSSLIVSHTEPRDDRLLIFGCANSGISEHRYVVRAVTAGEFVLPAAEASCMYDPAIYSVHGQGTVRINP